MKDKENSIKDWVIMIIAMGLLVIFLIIIYYLMSSIYHDIKSYKEYEAFCDGKQDLCYCYDWSCEFKTSSSQTCINNNCSNIQLSEDTQELCNLAKELNDKEVLFKIGC